MYKSSMYRKEHQRGVNKVFRELNKSIEKDDLWNGRFKAVQDASYMKHYEDNSGAFLWVVYHFVDTETGYCSKQFYEHGGSLCFLGGSRLFWQMNSFIVDECKV